ncbi:MAG: DUF3524 domain-containing protein [Anaerolineae bacterium]
MRVLLIEPYFGGSHRAWAESYQQHSDHSITLLTLPAQGWKWRMQGGAVTLARLFEEQNLHPDVIVVSDMLDLALFRALTRHRTANTPIALYFHESQFTYPQNQRQQHGWRYAFTNYTSALTADAVFFNSPYHLRAFFDNLPRMLRSYADYNELDTVEAIRKKSHVLSLGLDLQRFDAFYTEKPPGQPPLILWNHRWEEDKNPKAFFHTLYKLMEADIAFQVAITGENFRQEPAEFLRARDILGERVIQFGYVESFAEYARLLWRADYIISTAYQEFFGASVAEAIYCRCVPLLPNRLNYPYLIPSDLHPMCIYPGRALTPLLIKHIRGTLTVERTVLREHIAQADWSVAAPLYDAALASLV